MATAAEIRALIAAKRQEAEQSEAERQQALQERAKAQERQKLRRELEDLESTVMQNRFEKQFEVGYRQEIDRDQDGPYQKSGAIPPRKLNTSPEGRAQQSHVDCSAAVHHRELQWSIKGISWLKQALEQREEDYLESSTLWQCEHCFNLRYSPENVEDSMNNRGSLCIYHLDADDFPGVSFRYTIWIKSKERGWVQWGDTASICITDVSSDGMIFGPDVCKKPAVPEGIFGMNYTQMQQSEWVIDDMLTAKLQIEIRDDVDYEFHEQPLGITVPESKLGDQFLRLLDNGTRSDVTFVVQGEEIPAHSQILCTRSDVMQSQLSCGMQESISKRITVEDVDPAIFKVMLRFVYSDSLEPIEGFLAEKTTQQEPSEVSRVSTNSASNPSSHVETKMPILQQLLAVSHKYQLQRLQLWCERELCSCISVEDVCDVLCQAHLYDAQKLEEKCLEFIKVHMQEVVKTHSFGVMNQAWPRVSLKIILHQASVPESAAKVAMENQENARKRKRDE